MILAQLHLINLRMHAPDLFFELQQLLAQVPAGRVTTYGALAKALGDVTAARWVAACLLDPDGPVDWPGHRVVLRTGAVGRMVHGDTAEKARRLIAEGIDVHDACVDLALFEHQGFSSSQPLAALQEVQAQTLEQVSLEPPSQLPDAVGGVDVSYIVTSDSQPVEAVAAYALVDVQDGRLISKYTLRRSVRFPYIPGYLSFRESPILLELLDTVRRAGELAPVLFVDGNGRLHQRHAGIATHVGVLADVPTIGIGKSLLCGSVDLEGLTPGELRPVMHAGERVAVALRSIARGRPIFVSPGHRMDVDTAATIARQLSGKHRVPEPIHFAHSLSRAEAGRSRAALR